MKKNACLLLLAVAFLFACKKSDVPGVPVDEVPIDTGYHYTSDYAYNNDKISWAVLGNYVLKDIGGPQFIYLPATKTFKYFKVIVTSATDGRQYASLAEVGVFKN